MSACLCPAAIACATRALVAGEDPYVVECPHEVLDVDLLCSACRVGLCGAVRYVDEEGALVYEHTVVSPRLPGYIAISSLGVVFFGMN
jgi:hypothetical protein